MKAFILLLGLACATSAHAEGPPDSYLRIERTDRYGLAWFEVYKKADKWICRSKDYKKFFAKNPPLENWPDARIKKIGNKKACDTPAAAARVEKRKTLWEARFCAADKEFSELWRQLSTRCQGQF